MMQNNLFLNRLYILTEEGKVAYDETFHKGVNIIRGENSSGKSTITHFIFYVLGGCFSDFVPEAHECSLVQAEVEMDQAVFTIKRYLEKSEKGKINPYSPMYFYWGSMSECFNPPADKNWQKFGYKTTDDKKSFSNVLFDNLKLPIVKGDSNITFHQILRLLYIDQESPTSSLFYYENFDSQLTRETVADLLLGIYNEDLYEKKKDLILAEKQYECVKNEIKALKLFFTDPLTKSPAHIKYMIEKKEIEISDIQNKILTIRQSKQLDDKDNQFYYQELKTKVSNHRQLVVNLNNDIEYLTNEIQDTFFFIETLKKKIRYLQNSIQTREFLGNIPLEYCPECLSKIKPSIDNCSCKLCKEKIDQTYGVIQAKRLEQEIGFQINESTKIKEFHEKELIIIKAKYKAEFLNLEILQNQLDSAINDVKSTQDEIIDKLNVSKGFIEGEILQYKTLLENAEILESLQKKEDKLKQKIADLKDTIRIAESNKTKSKNKINSKIQEEGVYLLNNDLDRQDEFKNAKDFYIDFANNIAFLSNKYSKYSASSNFFLKISARFAIFLTSLSIPSMRYPRFIFADNMEDKGIEPERAQNLQHILINRVNELNPLEHNFQMIYTTSYITSELNKSTYVVGEYYTKERRTLKNIPKRPSDMKL